MTSKTPHIVILGSGPAGLGAAFQLTRQQKARATVIELRNTVGGNSGSFTVEGLYLDYGSHRLHPACDPEILDDIKQLLGDDLLVRPRHGRILLKNRWIHFPLNPLDLITRLPLKFGFGVAKDTLWKIIPGSSDAIPRQSSFATALQQQLGSTICQEFYFPYARKIWGLEPEEISEIQAQKRVSANSLGKIIKKVFSRPNHPGANGRPVFYYPKKGFGQISQAYFRAARNQGAEFVLSARVKEIHHQNETISHVVYEKDGKTHSVTADYIWSTLPLTVFTQALRPAPPEQIITANNRILFRSMMLIYLFLEQDQFTEYDAHYFPGEDIPITRLSEPKNYSNARQPEGVTALCAELPCNTTDPVWQLSDEELQHLVSQSLASAGIPITAPIRQVIVRRLPHAYPIYQQGFETYFEVLNEYMHRFRNLLSFGRQGLFVHDNTHHALYMAYAAVDCLQHNGKFDIDKWASYRKVFESHVVED